MAKGCFWSIVAVVFRPLATVLGFIGGLLASTVVISLINATYLPSFRDSQAGLSWGFAGFRTFIVVYFVLVYVSLNSIFKLPETVSAALYRWLGANAGGERDDAAGIAASVGVLAGRFTATFQTRGPRR